jgi:hypothetical protein
LLLLSQTNKSERVTQRELEGPRPAGTKEFARCVEGMVESCRVNRIVDSRVVPVGCASNVSDIEQVEGFGDKPERMRFCEVERPG